MKGFHALEGIGDDHLVAETSPVPIVSPMAQVTTVPKKNSGGTVSAAENSAGVQEMELQAVATKHNSASGNAAAGRESEDDKKEESNVCPSTPKKTPAPKECPTTPKSQNSACKDSDSEDEDIAGKSHPLASCNGTDPLLQIMY